jgi:hypothetical protein
VQGRQLLQYDFTSEQYRSLVKLTAAVCKVLPRIRCDYPRDQSGRLIPHKLPTSILTNYHGLLGHYHVQEDKIDPGPAFQWDYVITEARKLLHPGYADPDEPGNARMRGLFARATPERFMQYTVQRQLSVAIENQPGRLAAITRVMASHSINIKDISVVDNVEQGMIRMVTSDAAGCKALLV